jgi:hypothetical protein
VDSERRRPSAFSATAPFYGRWFLTNVVRFRLSRSFKANYRGDDPGVLRSSTSPDGLSHLEDHPDGTRDILVGALDKLGRTVLLAQETLGRIDSHVDCNREKLAYRNLLSKIDEIRAAIRSD